MNQNNFIDSLNPVQREAVVNYDRSSLIVAGAGSGKTRVLTCRIAYMLQQGVAPHSILALTFTNKAAAQMRERIAQLVGHQQSKYIRMGTFHSVFSRILRAESVSLGFPESFTIYDSDDSRNLVRRIIKDMSLSEDNYKPKDVISRISLAKNNLITAQAYAANSALMTEDRERKRPQTAEIYAMYVRRCKEYGAMDFDDLLLNINILFRDFPDVLAKYQNLFRYILVDEYQDTNYAQYVIIRRLAQLHSNVCVVGDDAQSIYSFRGAKIENILRFQSDFPDARTFKLERNYRSTRTIVAAANSVIEKNRNRIKKESFSEGEHGVKIKVLKAYTDQEEASMVADHLKSNICANGIEWSDVAILYRTNAQSRVMEEALRRRGIPYKIHGGMSFYQRKEVKDLIAYIRLVVNPRDDEAFRRVINYPARGIGDVTLEKINSTAKETGRSLWEVISSDMNPAQMGMNGGTAKRISDFAEMIRSISLMREHAGLYEIGLEIATRSGIIGHYKSQQIPEAMSALENIEELLNSMRSFADDWQGDADENGEIQGEITLDQWLQNIMLLTDSDNEKQEQKDRVTMMTIHSSKGLEFKFIFIVGLEDRLLPSEMSISSAEGIEEERRLFYVALTRAMEGVVLSFAQMRFHWGSMEFSQPSRFLSEIDARHLDMDFSLDRDAPQPEREQSKGQWGKVRLKENRPAAVGSIANVGKLKSMGTRIVDRDISTQVPAATDTIGVGTVVEHAKFGRGTIVASEQLSGDTKLTVDFGAGGTRTLLQKFAKLSRC